MSFPAVARFLSGIRLPASGIARPTLALALFVVGGTATSTAGPLTIDAAIRLALENNQRVKVSAYSPQIARANVLAAHGTFDPALTFRRTYSEDEQAGPVTPLLTRALTKNDDYSLSLDGVLPWGLTYSFGGTANNLRRSSFGFADNYVTFGGLTVTQPLLRGFGLGANLAGLRVARASRGISEWQHRQTVIDIVTEVIFVYNNLQEARDSLRIAQQARQLAAQLVIDNEKKFELQATSEAEVVQARAGVAGREESVLIAERRVRDVENRFRLLLGESTFPVDGAPLETIELEPAAEIAVSLAEDVRRAYELRPDYQAERLGVTIDRANSALAQNQLWPRLDFIGSYGYSGTDPDFGAARQQVRDRDARAFSAGIVIRVPLTFAEGRGRARAARLNLRRSEADLVRLEHDIAINITEAAGQIETTKQRVAAARIARDLAAQALVNEGKRLTAGTSTTFLVSNAQQASSFAQNSYARALADQRRAIANYHRELGTTLMVHRIMVE